jgi:hypothetical protein
VRRESGEPGNDLQRFRDGARADELPEQIAARVVQRARSVAAETSWKRMVGTVMKSIQTN